MQINASEFEQQYGTMMIGFNNFVINHVEYLMNEVKRLKIENERQKQHIEKLDERLKKYEDSDDENATEFDPVKKAVPA